MSIPPISSSFRDLFMQNLKDFDNQIQPINVEELLKKAKTEPAQLTKEQIQALEEDFGPLDADEPIASEHSDQKTQDAAPSPSNDWDD